MGCNLLLSRNDPALTSPEPDTRQSAGASARIDRIIAGTWMFLGVSSAHAQTRDVSRLPLQASRGLQTEHLNQ